MAADKSAAAKDGDDFAGEGIVGTLLAHDSGFGPSGATHRAPPRMIFRPWHKPSGGATGQTHPPFNPPLRLSGRNQFKRAHQGR
jgi:hypothetical protein